LGSWDHLGAILKHLLGRALALVGLRVILGVSWGHLEAKKATERRQKGDRNIVYNSVTFLSPFLALDGLWLGLWLALVGSGWAHGVICDWKNVF